jgi:hypothetical protein
MLAFGGVLEPDRGVATLAFTDLAGCGFTAFSLRYGEVKLPRALDRPPR